VRIVVTGASGNVGSALLRRLVADGGYDVLGIARRPPEPTGGPAGSATAPFDAVQWRSVDLSREASSLDLREAFAGADAVVHLAWGFQPSHDQAYLRELGEGGTARVLEAVAAADVPHLVHMSSVGAYSPKRDDEPVDESWPTGGVPSSWYSRSKSAAERLLDVHEAAYPERVLTRLRPGIIGQRTAGSALLRYALPGAVPSWVISHVPVLPLDRRLVIPMVHSDDVADAIVRVLGAKVGGPFNLSAEPPVTTAVIASVLGATPVHVPSAVVRAAMSGAWHARLQQVDPGWLDLGFAVPLMDTARATAELGWRPTVDARAVLEETIAGMRDAASDDTPVLRPRSVPQQLARMLRQGPVSSRQRP
jgi:nucleoside-diphosphate-sugar epimerase